MNDIGIDFEQLINLNDLQNFAEKILTYKRKFYQALKLDKLSNMFRTIKEYGKSLYHHHTYHRVS